MRWFHRCRSILVGVFRRRDLDEQFDRDVAFHLDQETAEYASKGMSLSEARRKARANFGSVQSVRDELRERRRLPLLELFLRDVGYAARGLRRNPGFALAAILSLAIGIGANTAVFSILHAVVLRPVAFAEPDRLYAAREVAPGLIEGTIPVNPVHAADWGRQATSVESVALMLANRMELTGAGDPALVMGAFVSPNLLSVIGVSPLLGRAFADAEAEPGRDGVVLVSESLWRSRFAADPDVVGRVVRIDGQQLAVVGVLPRSLRLPYSGGLDGALPSASIDLLRPLVLTPEQRGNVGGNFNYAAVVRLRTGASMAGAIEEMNAIVSRYPRSQSIETDVFATLIPVQELFSGPARSALLMLSGAAGVVLLIVCVNLANLLVARMASRRREVAIRAALGAGRARQMAQVFTDSLLIAAIGGGFGLMLAAGLLQLVAATALDIPRLDDTRLSGSVLAFAIGLTALTGGLFGAGPAWYYTGAHPQEALRASGRAVTDSRGGLRLRNALISVEVGLCTALLVTAVLLSGSLARLLRVDKGFEGAGVATVDVRLGGTRYADAASQDRFFDALLSGADALPSVEAAGLVTRLPTLGETWLDPIRLPGGVPQSVNNRWASPGYFGAMGIAATAGRVFDVSDRGTRVALLSEKAASLLWPDDPNPVGLTFLGQDGEPVRLVGIVADVRAMLEAAAPPTAYYPFWQRTMPALTLVVRTSGNPGALTPALRSLIRSTDPQLPVPAVRTMADVIGDGVAGRRFQALLVAAFAGFALLLSCIGIYGVVSYTVARRRNEIGIRMALGAPRARLFRRVIAQGMAPVVIGLVGGVALAFLVGQAIRGLLFELRPTEPLVIAGVAAVLLLVGVCACVIPARRAATTDVVSALRID